MMRWRFLAMAFAAVSVGLLKAPAANAADHGPATPVAGHSDEETHLTGTGAAFMRIQNGGSEDDLLLGGETEVANVVDVHDVG